MAYRRLVLMGVLAIGVGTARAADDAPPAAAAPGVAPAQSGSATATSGTSTAKPWGRGLTRDEKNSPSYRYAETSVGFWEVMQRTRRRFAVVADTRGDVQFGYMSAKKKKMVWLQARTGVRVFEEDSLRTQGQDAWARVQLSDGTVILMEGNTELEFVSLSTRPDDVNLVLHSGQVYYDVRKPKRLDEKFLIRTPQAHIRIAGTQGGVGTAGAATTASKTKGGVQVASSDPAAAGASVSLPDNTQSTVEAGKSPGTPQALPPEAKSKLKAAAAECARQVAGYVRVPPPANGSKTVSSVTLGTLGPNGEVFAGKTMGPGVYAVYTDSYVVAGQNAVTMHWLLGFNLQVPGLTQVGLRDAPESIRSRAGFGQCEPFVVRAMQGQHTFDLPGMGRAEVACPENMEWIAWAEGDIFGPSPKVDEALKRAGFDGSATLAALGGAGAQGTEAAQAQVPMSGARAASIMSRPEASGGGEGGGGGGGAVPPIPVEPGPPTATAGPTAILGMPCP